MTESVLYKKVNDQPKLVQTSDSLKKGVALGLLGLMSRRVSKASLFVCLMVLASVAPVIGNASASSPITLSLDNPHVTIRSGDSDNITLTIQNDGQYITTYSIILETSGLSDSWSVITDRSVTEEVVPLQSTTVNLSIVLDLDAIPADSGSFVINVSDDAGAAYNNITASLTVQPNYASSIGFSSTNGPLQQMFAGTNANFTVDVNNDGNAVDTILLGVEVEPDLAGFWANYTPPANPTTPTVEVPEDVLMYGDSFISHNNLDAILADLFNSVGEHNSTVKNTAIGLTLEDHWNNINNPGNVWNTSLRDSGHDWDFVVLQDDSLTPAKDRTSSDWIASMQSGILIADEVESEGSEVMLMMTWGYLSGDQSLTSVGLNYTLMQENLRQGYVDYHDNMTTLSREVWIAPVGLGFANIYQSVQESGIIPETPGSAFHSLYDTDGEHPSLKGSYLAACIIYASMTGNLSVETSDMVNLLPAEKLALQQAADDTVFNQTSNISYPWQQSTNPTLFNQQRTIPSGWNLIFADEEVNNLGAESSVQTTIQVSVPSDAAPGYYGYNLFSASTNGNTSSSYTFVIEVVPENDLEFAFLNQESDFFPGQTTTTTVQVSNTGNGELDLTWSITANSGPCVVDMVDASTSGLSPGATTDVSISVDVDDLATDADECVVTFDGQGMYGDYSYEAEEYIFTIDIDEHVEFELYYAGSVVDLTPQNSEEYEIRVYNNGSESVEFFLDINDDSPLVTSIVGESIINVPSGSAGIWTLSTDVSKGVVGQYEQAFSVTYGGFTSSSTVEFDVQPIAEFTISGPIDGRISLKPGETVDVSLDLTNTGTMDLFLSASVSGLPTGAEVVFSENEIDLDSGNTQSVTFSVSMVSTAQSGNHPIVISYSSSDFSDSLNLEMQVADSIGLTVNSISNNIAAGPISDVTYTFEVTNLGSASDTFFVALEFDEGDTNAQTWFETTLSTTSINLEPSSTQAVTISIREQSPGAPVSGCDVNVIVTSSNDETISKTIGFKIIPIQTSAQITVLSADDSAKPGDTITGTVSVKNTGTGEDQFSLTTIGDGCNLSEVFTLSSGISSQPYSWSCEVDVDADAGPSSLTFRVTSSARSNFFLEQVETYTVEPDWEGNNIAAITFDDEFLSMASSGGSSTTVTVTNLANAEISGDLYVHGSDEALFDITITPVSSNETSTEFTLVNGQSAEFKVLLISRISETEDAMLKISANVSIGENTYPQQSSNQLSVSVIGPELPPNGVELPLGVKLDEQQTINLIGGGWGLTLLLLILVSILRKRRKVAPVAATVEEAAEEPDKPEKKRKKRDEKTVKAHKLKSNECRMTPDNKVICPFCEAKLGVPRGSTPPFKFSCPQCDKKIRVVENQKF